MASPAFEKLMSNLSPGLAVPGDPLATVRSKMLAAHGAPVPADLQLEPVTLGGVTSAWIEAPGGPATDTLIFLVHGGAFVSCAIDEYRNYAYAISKSTGARVLVHAYRLAPEHRFPAPIEDSLAVYRALLDEGVAPERIVMAGDSCGGGIMVATALRLRDAGEPLPAGLASLCGWLDLEVTGESAANPQGVDPFVDPVWIRERARDYLGSDADARDPLASPLHAELAGLPPLFLQTGQVDVMRDDATRMATRAARAGVAVTLDVWPEMIHGFQGLAALLPEARGALRNLGDFCARCREGVA